MTDYYDGDDDGIRIINDTGSIAITTGTSSDEILIANSGSENETITVSSGDGSDSIVIDDSAGTVTIDSGSGSDKIIVNEQTGDVVIQSGDGNDKIYIDGVTGNVEVASGNGDDTIVIDDVTGDVSVDSGAGSDFVYVSDVGGDIVIDAGTGNDTVIIRGQNLGSVTVYGGAGDDEIYTGHQNDTVFGSTGHDLIATNGGDDMVYGGADNDIILGGSGNDELHGDEGHDAVFGGGGSDQVFGGDGNDLVSGGSGDDYVSGGAGDDKVFGGYGNDDLEGGAGNDFIDGGWYGNDTAIYSGIRAEYNITFLGWGIYKVEDLVANRDGVDYVKRVENYEFADGTIVVGNILNVPPATASSELLTDEDEAVILTLADFPYTDPEGGALVAVIIDSLPSNGSLTLNNVAVNAGDSIDPANIAAGFLVYTPALNASGDDLSSFQFRVTDGITFSAPASITFDVSAVADAPIVTANPVSGDEDTTIPLDLSVALADADGSESITEILVSGVPAGASLTKGTFQGGTLWSLSPSDLADVKIIPPLNSDVDIILAIQATSTESSNGDSATSDSVIFQVTVDAVADAPFVDTNSPYEGNEDSDIELDLSVMLTDMDGSESITNITISDVPSGASFSRGTDNLDGTWTFTENDLLAFPRLTFRPPENSDDDYILTLSATSTEASNQDTATASETFAIFVNAVADVPTLTAPTLLSGTSAAPISLNIVAALTDEDGSETLSLEVGNVPTGATLSAGVDNGDGTWTVAAGDIAGLQINVPTGLPSASLSVKAISTEANGGDTASSPVATIELDLNTAPVAVDDLSSDIIAIGDNDPLVFGQDEITVLEADAGGVFSLLTNDFDVDGTIAGVLAGSITNVTVSLPTESALLGGVTVTAVALGVDEAGHFLLTPDAAFDVSDLPLESAELIVMTDGTVKLIKNNAFQNVLFAGGELEISFDYKSVDDVGEPSALANASFKISDNYTIAGTDNNDLIFSPDNAEDIAVFGLGGDDIIHQTELSNVSIGGDGSDRFVVNQKNANTDQGQFDIFIGGTLALDLAGTGQTSEPLVELILSQIQQQDPSANIAQAIKALALLSALIDPQDSSIDILDLSNIELQAGGRNIVLMNEGVHLTNFTLIELMIVVAIGGIIQAVGQDPQLALGQVGVLVENEAAASEGVISDPYIEGVGTIQSLFTGIEVIQGSDNHTDVIVDNAQQANQYFGNGGDDDIVFVDGYGGNTGLELDSADGGAGIDNIGVDRVGISGADEVNIIDLTNGTFEIGDSGINVLRAYISNFENVTTGDGDNTVIGNAENNTFRLGTGVDFVTGLDGDDTFVYENKNDGLFDQLYGGSEFDTNGNVVDNSTADRLDLTNVTLDDPSGRNIIFMNQIFLGGYYTNAVAVDFVVFTSFIVQTNLAIAATEGLVSTDYVGNDALTVGTLQALFNGIEIIDGSENYTDVIVDNALQANQYYGNGGDDDVFFIGDLSDSTNLGVLDTADGGETNETLGDTIGIDRVGVFGVLEQNEINLVDGTLKVFDDVNSVLVDRASFSNFENVTTGDGNDTIFGDDFNNIIRSGAGDDQIFAGDGDDIINMGPGSDVVEAGDGADRFVFTEKNGTYFDVNNNELPELDFLYAGYLDTDGITHIDNSALDVLDLINMTLDQPNGRNIILTQEDFGVYFTNPTVTEYAVLVGLIGVYQAVLTILAVNSQDIISEPLNPQLGTPQGIMYGVEIYQGAEDYRDVFIDLGNPGSLATEFYGNGGDDDFLFFSNVFTSAPVTFADGGDGIDNLGVDIIGASGPLEVNKIDMNAGTFEIYNDGTMQYHLRANFTNIENVSTGDGNDEVIGDAGNNIIKTGAGDDILDGGAGDDILDGGIGNDILTGGLGLDIFVSDISDFANQGGFGNDYYSDFDIDNEVVSFLIDAQLVLNDIGFAFTEGYLDPLSGDMGTLVEVSNTSTSDVYGTMFLNGVDADTATFVGTFAGQVVFEFDNFII